MNILDQEYATQLIKKLYTDHCHQVFRFILIMVKNHQIAEELTHDTFLRAYQKADTFQGRSTEKTWLYSIARHVTIDYLRKKKPLQWVSDVLGYSTVSSQPLPSEVIIFQENEKELYEAIQRLKQTYREVIMLRKIEELSTEETARILGWSESKVKTTLLRALKKLESELVEEGYIHDTLQSRAE